MMMNEPTTTEDVYQYTMGLVQKRKETAELHDADPEKRTALAYIQLLETFCKAIKETSEAGRDDLVNAACAAMVLHVAETWDAAKFLERIEAVRKPAQFCSALRQRDAKIVRRLRKTSFNLEALGAE
jgi:hypothetical protein